MSNLINQIAEAIEAEIHEAWTESDADFIRGMEYAVSIVKALDIRTDSDTISRADAMGAVQDHFNADGFKGYDDGQKMMDRIKALPSAEQVTGKLNKCGDSLLTEDSDACKEQNCKLDLISRDDAIALVIKAIHGTDNEEIKEYLFDGLRKQMWSLPSAESTGAMDEAIQEYIKDGYMQPIGEDLISRQDAIDAFGLSEKTRKYGGDHSGYNTMMLYEIQDVLESLPSAPDSRQRGEWIEVEVFPEVYDIDGVKTWGSEMQCDQCGFRHTAIEGHMTQYNFCPSCGARIYKGGDNE